MGSQKKRLIVFVTDAKFLLPSVRAAMDALAQPRVREIADCMVFVIDPGDGELDRLNDSFSNVGLRFAPLNSRTFIPEAFQVFHRSHVPTSTLGRLVIGRHLPDSYDHIIYLDGDIAILGDIHPLVSHDVAPGHLAAATDALWLYQNNGWRSWQRSARYLADIGVKDPRTYFNAGVLLSTRQAWQDITAEALEYFIRNSDRCMFHDQSALNAVVQGRREYISPRFNFLTEYAMLGFTGFPDIRIAHFTGHKKPWEHVGPPWNGRFYARWREAAEAWPMLAEKWSPRPPYRRDRDLWTHFKRTIRSLEAAPWKNEMRAKMLADTLQMANYAVKSESA